MRRRRGSLPRRAATTRYSRRCAPLSLPLSRYSPGIRFLQNQVRVAREARGAMQQQLEAREAAIVRLRAERQQAQSQLSEAVEGRVATEAASRASSDELQRVHAELKVLQLRVGQ